MNCTKCKAEWTPPAGVSVSSCPFCGKPIFELKDNGKNAEPHEILQEIVQRYDRQKLGDTLLKGLLSDLMPHIERKYQRIFKQALDDRIGAKLLDLEDEEDCIRVVKINTLKDSFKNNNGFDKTADYVVDCFLFALGWIETINKEQYKQGGVDMMSIISQQIDMATVDGVLLKEEAKTIFLNSQKLGLADSEIVNLINAKIDSLKLKPYPATPESLKNITEIICYSDWYSKNKYPKRETSKLRKPSIKEETLKIKDEMTGTEIQVALKDFANKMPWEKARRACSDLGSGWRLPTTVELKMLQKHLHRQGKENFKKDDAYWSSKEYGSDAVFFSFKSGDSIDVPKANEFYVRAVRTIINFPLEQKYKTIKIGNQVWMGDNLNVEEFRNGDEIPNIQSPKEWIKYGEEKKPAWCYYENNTDNRIQYGRLYNWWAVTDGRGLAPMGWHISTETEWKELKIFCDNKPGNKLKSKNFWTDKKGTDDYGFSGLPSGYRDKRGKFGKLGSESFYWTSNEFNKGDGIAFYIWSYMSGISKSFKNKAFGFSVRCLKD